MNIFKLNSINQGTEAEAYVKKSAKTVKKKPVETANKKSDWRRKHEEFIQAIRSAKQMQQHLAKGSPFHKSFYYQANYTESVVYSS